MSNTKNNQAGSNWSFSNTKQPTNPYKGVAGGDGQNGDSPSGLSQSLINIEELQHPDKAKGQGIHTR